MHMADALISLPVGAAFWAISGGVIAYSARKISQENDQSSTPLMAVMGAFIFAAQMINFSIPGTGSSGHLAGGLLLALVLGPYRSLITLTSVLAIQSLFFADGGLLALGCNIFNLAIIPSFCIYPLVANLLTKSGSKHWVNLITVLSAIVCLLVGAFMVVLQTVLSGISSLPFGLFLSFMLPIHLAIGLVEGIVTAAIYLFVRNARPDAAESTRTALPRWVPLAFLAAALVSAGIISWFASSYPDGLEWSIERAAGSLEVVGVSGYIHQTIAWVQERIAFLPDYQIPALVSASENGPAAGTSLAGIAGSIMSLGALGGLGLLLRVRLRKTAQ